jgi:hypothetical protein
MFVHCCHCLECQNLTGSAFVMNALVETALIKKRKGSLEKIEMSKGEESPHDVYRCKKCKVALWSDYGRRPKLKFLRIATLDRPKLFKPDVHIFTRSKLPWVILPKNIPQFEVYYDMKKLWPKASLKRREAILGSGK